jgi:hypothetical protein
VLLEVVIASVFMSQQHQIHVPLGLLDSLFGLSLARIVTLGIMIALLVCREYEFKDPEQGPESERQSLLENGNGPNGYGSDSSKPETQETSRCSERGLV